MYKLRSKIWLESNRGKIFGDGPCELLEKVERMGSLRQAAADMKMSYRQAWDLVRMLEENLGFPLLERQAGGSQGGGSSVTGEGKKIMCRYKKFRQKATISMETLFDQYFGEST